MTALPFSSTPIHTDVVAALAQMGLNTMTHIQSRVVAPLLQGLNVVGHAKTGSGKTLAYLVPTLHRVLATYANSTEPSFCAKFGSSAIVVAPTKELALQIHEVLEKLLGGLPKDRPVSSAMVVGGQKLKKEQQRLNEGASFVIATPGRLADHLQNTQVWKYSSLMVLILDEADRLLSDGFQREVDTIFKRVPKHRQTLLFSATNNESLQKLSRIAFTTTPFLISVGEDGANAQEVDLSRYLEDLQNSSQMRSGTAQIAETLSKDLKKKEKKRARDEADNGIRLWGDADDNLYELDDDLKAQTKRKKKAKPSGTEAPRAAQAAPADEDGVRESPRRNMGEGPTVSGLTQYYTECYWEHRLMYLYCFLKWMRLSGEPYKVMVFFSTCASVQFHQELLNKIGIGKDLAYGVLSLSGKMKLRQRLSTYEAFCQSEKGILFCTDVAARGLDIPKVNWIIQFDPPSEISEYIHRVGRTARAGGVGKSLILLHPVEMGFLKILEAAHIHVGEFEEEFPVPNLQLKLERIVTADHKIQALAVRAFKAFVMSYQSHKLTEVYNTTNLDLECIAIAFGLGEIPTVTVKAEKKEYTKGVVKSYLKKMGKEKFYNDQMKYDGTRAFK